MSMRTENLSSHKYRNWDYLCNSAVVYVSCLKSLASTRKSATDPEPLTHFLMLSAQNKTLSLWRVQTKSEELTQDTLVSHTGNRKSLVPVIQFREPVWVATSPAEWETNLAWVQGSWVSHKQELLGRQCWKLACPTSVYKMSMHTCMYFSQYCTLTHPKMASSSTPCPFSL